MAAKDDGDGSSGASTVGSEGDVSASAVRREEVDWRCIGDWLDLLPVTPVDTVAVTEEDGEADRKLLAATSTSS